MRKEWLWKCPLPGLLYALFRLRPFSSAAFPALSLVLMTKELHSQELTHAVRRSPQMEACCSIQQLLRLPDVEARCKYGTTFPRSSVHFWALGRNGILSDDRMRGFTWVWWILTFHSCNCKKSLFVRATVNFLWMLLLFRENKYFPPLFYIPSSLMLKTGNWSGASKCNLAQRLSLPPNDTCCSSLLRQSCSHYP